MTESCFRILRLVGKFRRFTLLVATWVRGVLLMKQEDKEGKQFPGRLGQSRFGAEYSAALAPLAAL